MSAPRLLLLASLSLLLVAVILFLFGTSVDERVASVAATAPVSHSHILQPSNPTATKSSSSTPSPQPRALEKRIRELVRFTSPSERLELMRSLQALGGYGNNTIPLLREALTHADQDVRRAAMRGLAATQSLEAISLLRNYLDDNIPIEESTEAALALATIEDPSVPQLLQGALEKSKDPVLREHVVDALVSRPPGEVDSFVDAFLARADVASEEKQNLLRMSGLNNTKPAEFLAAQIQSPDESLRLGAYQGLALVSESRQAQNLLPKITSEKDPYNRALVYEALGNQIDANTRALGVMADTESDSYARLRALKAWAESAEREDLPLAADTASQFRVAELETAALNHADVAERRVALFALGLLRHDPMATPALERVAEESSSEKLRALAQSLLSRPD